MKTLNNKEKTFFGQPIGVSTLFFTELWERFSYYGGRAILVFYMYYSIQNGGLGIDKTLAKEIMSTYGAFIFLSSLLGGYLADKFFGEYKSILYGGILIMVGDIFLSLPFARIHMLFIGMSIIIIGTGMLKPNTLSSVGNLYSDSSIKGKKDSGYSIYYMGINIGAFASPIVIGLICGHSRFQLGFLFSAVGMFFGLVQYVIGAKKYFPKEIFEPKSNHFNAKKFFIGAFLVILIIICLPKLHIVSFQLFINVFPILIIIILITYISFIYKKLNNSNDKKNVKVFLFVFFVLTVSTFSQNQQATIFAEYADKNVNNKILSINYSPEFYQSLDPIYILILTPLLVYLWKKFNNVRNITKMTSGIMVYGFMFLIAFLVEFSRLHNGVEGKVSSIWVFVFMLLITIGERFCGPIGWAVTSAISPKKYISQFMSLILVTDALGQALDGLIAKFYDYNSVSYFLCSGVGILIVGIILFIFSRKSELLKNI